MNIPVMDESPNNTNIANVDSHVHEQDAVADSWQIEADETVAAVRFSEAFSLNDVDAAAQTLESEGYTHQHRLFDLSQSGGLTPTTTELLEIARRSADWIVDDTMRFAWIAASQVDAGLLRIITSKFNDTVMKVFVSEIEARRWIAGAKVPVQDSPGLVEHLPVRLRGSITLDEIMRTQQSVRATEDYLPSTPLLWDLRESRLTESLSEVKDLAVFIAGNHSRDRIGYKSAVLVDSHLMGLLIREMSQVSEWPSEDVVVFRSYRDAVAWLAL